MDFFLEEGHWKRCKDEVIERINRSGLPLVLFGKSGVVNQTFFQRITVPLRHICDNNPEKWGSTLWGLEVINPARLQTLYTAYNVLILVPFEHQIIPQLNQLPVPPAEIFRLDLYFEEEHSAAYFQSVRQDMEKIMDCLCDQQSKDTYEAVIRYRINRDPELLSQVLLPRSTQYFPDTLDGTPFLGSCEVFADAGAFVGDTVESFCCTVGEQYRAVYAFEPDEENYKKLLNNASQRRNISCKQTAVGETEGTLHFFSEDSSSRQDTAGAQVVPVDTLDHLLDGAQVTYLKMDVEGMECAALRGARRLIQTCCPKLAICIYHSDSDMIEVPKLILELNPDYKLYIRHYSNALVETVCYAI